MIARLDITRSTIPCLDEASSPVQWVPPTAVAPLLERVEQLPHGSNGAMLFGQPEAPSGAILVEDGRICWAADRSMKTRLTDILRQSSDPHIEPVVLRRVFSECRKSGRPFGESLVSEGLLTETALRRALRQHTAESIAALGLLGFLPVTFRPSGSKRYDARFTFSPCDLLCTIGALRNAEVAVLARMRLRELLPDGGIGAAFTRSDTMATPVPVGVASSDQLQVGELMDAGRWSIGAQDISDAIGAPARVYAAGLGDGRFATTWSEDGVSYMVFCESSAALVAILGRTRRGAVSSELPQGMRSETRIRVRRG